MTKYQWYFVITCASESEKYGNNTQQLVRDRTGRPCSRLKSTLVPPAFQWSRQPKRLRYARMYVALLAYAMYLWVHSYTHTIKHVQVYTKTLEVNPTHTRHGYNNTICPRLDIRVGPCTHVSWMPKFIHTCTYQCAPTRKPHKETHIYKYGYTSVHLHSRHMQFHTHVRKSPTRTHHRDMCIYNCIFIYVYITSQKN